MKRSVDVLGASFGLVLCTPVLAIAAVIMLLVQGRPILFGQRRAGLGGQCFTVWKLRTMTAERDETGRLLPDADRMTKVGRFLRTSSVDELPELWNVLRGEMSLVGPRPLPVEYLPRYSASEARRHEVRPGITGWAQVNGRNAVGWDERLAMDVWYVDHRTALLDVRIVLLTFALVTRRHGISAAGEATMSELRPHLGEPSRAEDT